MTRPLHSLAAALSIAALSAVAAATPTFPAVLQTELKLTATPACAACHNGPTARGTVTTPLGKALMSRRMAAYDEASLKTAIQALLAEKNQEILKLQAGGAVAGPEYGCSVGQPTRSHKGAASSTLAAVAACALAAKLGARRRR